MRAPLRNRARISSGSSQDLAKPLQSLASQPDRERRLTQKFMHGHATRMPAGYLDRRPPVPSRGLPLQIAQEKFRRDNYLRE